MTSLVVEALTVGIITAIIGFIINIIVLKDTNNWYKVILGYFLTGLCIHLLFEYTGGNKWYCKNGNACKSN